MARGWESKAVADQIEEGEATKARRTHHERITAEERTKQERLVSLKLSRARLLEQLERAKHPVHRGMLLNGLKVIEQEIEDAAFHDRD